MYLRWAIFVGGPLSGDTSMSWVYISTRMGYMYRNIISVMLHVAGRGPFIGYMYPWYMYTIECSRTPVVDTRIYVWTTRLYKHQTWATAAHFFP